MSAYFVPVGETVRIELEHGEWVELKARMSFGDRLRIREVAYRIRYSPEGESTIDSMLAEGQVMSLLRNIVAWSFKDEQGRSLPITRENIERFDPEFADRLIAEVDRLNAPKSGSGDGTGGE